MRGTQNRTAGAQGKGREGGQGASTDDGELSCQELSCQQGGAVQPRPGILHFTPGKKSLKSLRVKLLHSDLHFTDTEKNHFSLNTSKQQQNSITFKRTA